MIIIMIIVMMMILVKMVTKSMVTRQGSSLSIRAILSASSLLTIFCDNLYCISSEHHPNRETAMLSNGDKRYKQLKTAHPWLRKALVNQNQWFFLHIVVVWSFISIKFVLCHKMAFFKKATSISFACALDDVRFTKIQNTPDLENTQKILKSTC